MPHCWLRSLARAESSDFKRGRCAPNTMRWLLFTNENDLSRAIRKDNNIKVAFYWSQTSLHNAIIKVINIFNHFNINLQNLIFIWDYFWLSCLPIIFVLVGEYLLIIVLHHGLKFCQNKFTRRNHLFQSAFINLQYSYSL